MIFLLRFLDVFVVYLLSSQASATQPVPRHSLWGSMADFTSDCSHWSLKPEVYVPALQEFTVCFNLQLQRDSSPWTAFMYRHPDVQYAELGVGGKYGRLVVWLFGEEWTTERVNINLGQWSSLCLTWSHFRNRPTLYVNRSPVGLSSGIPAPTPPLRCQLAPNGSLTLGAAHALSDGSIVVNPIFGVSGKLSLFRMWGRERSREEVTSLFCTEGDVVRWDTDDWDTRICAPISDPSLRCVWSSYEVKLTFLTIRHDGNDTDHYQAREIAHKWFYDVLPKTYYLHRVSVFEVTRSEKKDLVKASNQTSQTQYSTPNINRFDSLVYLSIYPKLDVAEVQACVDKNLSTVRKDPSGVDLLADKDSIRTTPVESFSDATDIPPSVMTKPCPVLTSTMIPPSTPTTTLTTTSTGFSSSLSTSPTGPAGFSDLYFQVKVNVSIKGDYNPAQTISIWLNSTLSEDSMIVLDIEVLQKDESRNMMSRVSPAEEESEFKVSRYLSRESCVFQVQVMKPSGDAQKMEEKIREALQKPFINGAVSIETEDIEISRILIYMCGSERRQTWKGLFVWPETLGRQNATQKCPKDPSRLATRHCKLCLVTRWMVPDLEDCPPVVETIPDLDHVKVTSENALDVLEMIEELLRNQSALNYQDLLTILSKLEDIVSLNEVTLTQSQTLIDIISDILQFDSDLTPFTNTILTITEAVGDKMVGYEGSSTLVTPAVALSVVNVAPGQFHHLTFGVSSDRTGTNLEISINKFPHDDTVAFVSLPSVLQRSFPQPRLNHQPPRVQFQFYGKPLLFKDTNPNGPVLNTFVVSASVTNTSAPIRDLPQEVQVTLHHIEPNTHKRKVHCVFWNYNKNNGHGGWDDYGCRKHNTTVNSTTCLCDHLTHFGVLLDVSRTPLDPFHERTLTMITYVGCGVSSVFLGVTLLTYTAFEKLRRDYPSQILINLTLALLGLNLVFLINSWVSSLGVYGLCVAIASMLHYFLLASFTWMGLEAVNMYFALVKVFNVYVPSYILKFCVLGWGLPLVICTLVLIVNREVYGTQLYTDTRSTFAPLDNSDYFCWLQDDVTFYVSVVAYAVLIFLFNIGIFIVVLIQIRHMRANSPAGTRSGLMQDLRGVASLTLLLGLTWTAGFFTWGPIRIVMLYLFAGLNTLQGLFIFFFHCLMRENVRKQWRVHLCFGRFRLDEYSEWSNSASIRVQAKPRPNPPRPSRPSVRSIKSSSTDSTSASSNSSQRDTSCRRPNLGLFVNSLALPRAQRKPSAADALPSYRGGQFNTWLEE